MDADAKKLVVTEMGTGREVVVPLGAQAAIATGAGRVLGIGDLREGDGVGVALASGVATQVVVNQATLKGVVNSVDADKKTLVMTEAGTGKDVTLKLGDRTMIEATGGKVLKLADLKPGDGVGVTRDGAAVAKVAVDPKPAELIGHVKTVAANLKSLVVTESGTNKDYTVVVNGQTRIATADGKAIDLKDLKKGDGVGIAHTDSVASKIVVNVAPAR